MMHSAVCNLNEYSFGIGQIVYKCIDSIVCNDVSLRKIAVQLTANTAMSEHILR